MNIPRKLIIFDLDGVLFDTGEVVNRYFMKRFPTLTEKEMNDNLMGNFHEGLEKIKQIHKQIVETPEEEKIRMDNFSNEKMKSPLFEGMRELLNELHVAGHILAINTSAMSRNSLPLFEYSKTKELFDFFGTAETSKSKVEKFKIIEDTFKVPKEETVFITDTIGDVKEADIAGVPTIAVTWGVHKRADFIKGNFKNLVGIVDTSTELSNLLK